MSRMKFIKVPMDFYEKAKRDIDTFLRDDAGIPTISITPLFKDISKFSECIDKTTVNPFDDTTLSLSESFLPEPDKNYYIHLDGSAGGDGYGIAMASLEGWTDDIPQKQIVRINLLGCPSKRTYGKDFSPELVEEIVKELVYRGFNIKILTYDRATIIRDIKPIIEACNGIVEHMSIDRTANFPVIDYEAKEPPFYRIVSTQGNYYQPMVDFKELIERKGIIVPYHHAWLEIPYTFEINMNKRIVTKLPGKQDDLGQACAGAVFHVLNNEKDTSMIINNEFIPIDKPDKFEKEIEKLRIELEKSTVNKENSFDYEDPIPDEIEIDDFEKRLRNRFYL